MSDLEMKLLYWNKQAEHVFEICNGWINPINPAISLKFNSISKNDHESFRYLGQCDINEINIDILSVFEFCIVRGYNTVEQVRAIIDYVVIHELSHCDQKFNHTLPISSQEIANDNNVARFVLENKNSIETHLCYRLDELFFDYLSSKIKDSIRYPYVRIVNPYDKILELVTPFCLDYNIYKIPSILIESVDTKRSHYIKYNGTFSSFLISAEYMKQLIKDCNDFKSICFMNNDILCIILERLV